MTDTDARTLTEAKDVIRTMRSDSSDNGIFIDNTSLASKGRSFACAYERGLSFTTTQRVIDELEAKGLVEDYAEYSRGHSSKYLKLTHAGWTVDLDGGIEVEHRDDSALRAEVAKLKRRVATLEQIDSGLEDRVLKIVVERLPEELSRRGLR